MQRTFISQNGDQRWSQVVYKSGDNDDPQTCSLAEWNLYLTRQKLIKEFQVPESIVELIVEQSQELQRHEDWLEGLD